MENEIYLFYIKILHNIHTTESSTKQQKPTDTFPVYMLLTGYQLGYSFDINHWELYDNNYIIEILLYFM